MTLIRTQPWDVVCLSEVHSTESALGDRHIVYIEDLMFIFSGTVGLALTTTMRVAWHAAVDLFDSEGDRACSAIFTDNTGIQFGILVHYVVTDNFQGSAAMRDDSSRCIRSLSTRVQKLVGSSRVIAGDWNAHTSRDEHRIHSQLGRHGLGTHATRKGIRFREFLETTNYVLVDSFKYISKHVTWRHRNGDWYELDFAVSPESMTKNIEKISVLSVGTVSDHKAKIYRLRFPQQGRQQKRKQRADKFATIQQRKQQSIQCKGRLQTDLMRGGTTEALEKAEQYRALVQQRLTEIRGSLPVLAEPPVPALGVRPMSEEELRLNSQWPQVTFSSWTHDWIECYTDGSYIPNSQTAGWRVASCEKEKCFPFWGAVQLDPTAPDFCGPSSSEQQHRRVERHSVCVQRIV